MSWIEGNWSDPHFIADKTHAPWGAACEDRPGVYRLIGLENEGIMIPAKINRVCGTDGSGTIYLGAAKSLVARIGRLVLQHLPPFKGGNHTAMSEALAKRFPAPKLAICWRFVDPPEDIFNAEHNLMLAYKTEFGETPPLNSQG